MDSHIPNPSFGLSLTLISSSDQDRHPENVKSDFTTTLHEPVQLDGQWGMSLESLTYSNDLVNYEGEETRPHGEDEEMPQDGGVVEEAFAPTESDEGGVLTPWIDDNGSPLMAGTILPRRMVFMDVALSEKKTNGKWYLAYPPLSVLVQLEDDGTGRYDIPKATLGLSHALRWTEFDVVAPCVPNPPEDGCTTLTISNPRGNKFFEPMLLEPMLSRWPSMNTLLLEFLVPYVAYSSQGTVVLAINRGGKITMTAPTGSTISLTRGPTQTHEDFQSMCDHWGMGAVKGDKVSAMAVSRDNFMTAPVAMKRARDVPDGYNPFNYLTLPDGVTSVTRSTAPLGVWPRDDTVANALSAFKFRDLMNKKRGLDVAREVINRDVAYDGDVKVIMKNGHVGLRANAPNNGTSIIYSYQIKSVANGYLSRILGLNVAEITFSGDYYRPEGLSKSVVQVRAGTRVMFNNPYEVTLTQEKKMSDYVEVSVAPHHPSSMQFTMKKADSIHGFCAVPRTHNCMFGQGASVMIRSMDPLAMTNDTEGDPDVLATPPLSDKAFLNLVTLSDLMDARVLRQDGPYTMVVRGHTCQQVEMDVITTPMKARYAEMGKPPLGFVKSVELLCTIGGPAAFKAPDVLKDEIMRSMKLAITDRAQQWRRLDNLELKAEDLLNIQWVEGERKFDFSCGPLFDYVEVAVSPKLASLCGWDRKEVLLRLIHDRVRYLCTNTNHGHGRGEGTDHRLPMPLDTVRRRAGGMWVMDPTYVGRYPFQTHINGPYPVSLSVGVNNIFVHMDAIDDTEYVGSDRTNVLGIVPINWKEEGNDVHVPIHRQYVHVPHEKLARMRVQLLDYKGDRIKFMSNNGATVIVVLNLKRIV